MTGMCLTALTVKRRKITVRAVCWWKPLQGKVMLVDDVITAGTAIRESMDIINAHDASLAGVMISLDRQERGRRAFRYSEVERDYSCKVTAIITLNDLIDYLAEKRIWPII